MNLVADVAVLVPIHNCEKYLEECFLSLSSSSFQGSVQISVVDDNSTDNSFEIAKIWQQKLPDMKSNFKFLLYKNDGKEGLIF